MNRIEPMEEGITLANDTFLVERGSVSIRVTIVDEALDFPLELGGHGEMNLSPAQAVELAHALLAAAGGVH
jgi:hypothetical protein